MEMLGYYRVPVIYVQIKKVNKTSNLAKFIAALKNMDIDFSKGVFITAGVNYDVARIGNSLTVDFSGTQVNKAYLESCLNLFPDLTCLHLSNF